MENASRALIMAGGILLVMLIIGLIFFARGRITDFYNDKDKLAEIEDVSKFNLQFTNYDNRDVHGYELISLANKVADYNDRYSSAEGARNDKKYNPITMKIDLAGKAEEFKNKEDGSVSGNLFTRREYTIDATNNNFLNITDFVNRTEREYGSVENATKLAKSINSLILSEDQLKHDVEEMGGNRIKIQEEAVKKYNSIASEKIDIDTNNIKGEDLKAYLDMKDKLLKVADIMKYYEYYQFKRGIFKCNDIKYDDTTGRVSEIDFIFTGSLE